MIKKTVFCLLLFFLLSTSQAFPWGAIEGVAPTHQLILRNAYDLLKQDPAFQGGKGLPVGLEQILAHEGVKAVVSNGKSVMIPGIGLMPFGYDKAVGPGPDAAGASRYSLHYYNPVTEEGRAPKAVQYYFKRLLDPASSDKSKGTAWAAHFLADMSVPYHVVGMSGSQAKFAMQKAENNNQLVKLSEAVSGPLFLYRKAGKSFSLLGQSITSLSPRLEESPPDGWGGNRDFTEATKNYLDFHAAGDADWYDPWYSNGGVSDVLASSHVVWEYFAHEASIAINPPSGYNKHAWKNYEIGSFKKDDIVNKQAKKSSAFAIAAASYTRKNIKEIHANAEIGIENAIQNVATLWRASISGLSPKIIIESVSAGGRNMYRFKCTVKNLTREMALNGKVKIYITLAGKSIHAKIKTIGQIPSRKTKVAEFLLPLGPDRDYEIKMVVIAEYKKTPDLQYATETITYHSRPETTDSLEQTENTNNDLSSTYRTTCLKTNPKPLKGRIRTYPEDNSAGKSYLVCTYFSDGALQRQTPFNAGKKKEGLEIEYYLSKGLGYKLNRKTTYKNGVKHGLSTAYSWCMKGSDKKHYKAGEYWYEKGKQERKKTKTFPSPCRK